MEQLSPNCEKPPHQGSREIPLVLDLGTDDTSVPISLDLDQKKAMSKDKDSQTTIMLQDYLAKMEVDSSNYQKDMAAYLELRWQELAIRQAGIEAMNKATKSEKRGMLKAGTILSAR